MNANRIFSLTAAVLAILPGVALAQSPGYEEAPPLPEPGSEQAASANAHTGASTGIARRARPRMAGGITLSTGTGLWRGPGAHYPRLRSVRTTTTATVLSNVGGWRRVRLMDGSIGWLSPRNVADAAQVRRVENTQPANSVEDSAQTNAVGATSGPRTADDSSDQATPNVQPNPQSRTTIPPIKPAVLVRPPRKNMPSNILASAPEKERKAAGAFAGTKPDPTDKTQDSPAATLGDAWKMLLYLAPMLLIIVLTIRALKSLQQRTGKIGSGVKQGLLGGLNLANARKTGGSSIRVVESVPVGSISLHLVEVRGKLLLLGGAGTSVSLLTEFEDAEAARSADFQSLLNEVSSEMETEADRTGSFNAVVNSLEEQIRQAREAMMQNSSRTRPWNQEAG